MIRAYPENMLHISGNEFDPDKLAAVVSGIQEAPDRVVFTAPYGEVNVVELIDVKESQKNFEEDGLERPYTTGDEELDQYVEDPAYALVDYDMDSPEEAEAKRDFEDRLRYAVEHDEGDLGAIVVTIRDGNHRAFGALLAGEPYVYVMVSDNQMQDLKDAKKRRKLTRSGKRIWDALE